MAARCDGIETCPFLCRFEPAAGAGNMRGLVPELGFLCGSLRGSHSKAYWTLNSGILCAAAAQIRLEMILFAC